MALDGSTPVSSLVGPRHARMATPALPGQPACGLRPFAPRATLFRGRGREHPFRHRLVGGRGPATLEDPLLRGCGPRRRKSRRSSVSRDLDPRPGARRDSLDRYLVAHGSPPGGSRTGPGRPSGRRVAPRVRPPRRRRSSHGLSGRKDSSTPRHHPLPAPREVACPEARGVRGARPQPRELPCKAGGSPRARRVVRSRMDRPGSRNLSDPRSSGRPSSLRECRLPRESSFPSPCLGLLRAGRHWNPRHGVRGSFAGRFRHRPRGPLCPCQACQRGPFRLDWLRLSRVALRQRLAAERRGGRPIGRWR